MSTYRSRPQRIKDQIKDLQANARYLEAVILDLFNGDSEKKEEHMEAHMKEHCNIHTGEYMPIQARLRH